jgi:hypothetical protein
MYKSPAFEWLDSKVDNLPADVADVSAHYVAGQNHRL